jgi:nucleoside-diphosphate-sugar epimerase
MHGRPSRRSVNFADLALRLRIRLVCLTCSLLLVLSVGLQDAYGLEKLVSEEIAMHYAKDFAPMITRVARFHNIYGPQGTWHGGREKAPAAFCRKVAVFTHVGGEVEMWGNGKQTRSFCYVDDCVEGILRLTLSDYDKPLNLGSDEMVSMNQLVDITSCAGFRCVDDGCTR